MQGGREGAGEMGLGEKSCPLHHPCCAGLIVVHRCRLQELGACADDPPRGGPRLGCWHGSRRARQQPGLHVRRRLREEQVEARLVCGHLHCGCAAWPKVPPWQCPECGPCLLLRVPFVAPGGSPSRRGRGRATGRPASAVGARVVSAASAVDFMAFHPAARRRHPVVLGEVRAEEGRRRVVSSCFPPPRRPGRVGGEAPQYILRCGEPPSIMDATILHRVRDESHPGRGLSVTKCPVFFSPWDESEKK